MLLDTDVIEINKIVTSLKNTSSSGWDGITSIFLKKCLSVLVEPIMFICNTCLSTGVFPKVLKDSIVLPIFKTGEREKVTNYRPISLLPTLSKILEKVLNNRLVNFLEKHNLLSGNQFGFRSKRSTFDAIESLVTEITNNIDKQFKCVGVFLDLAKAFDTVSIPLLLCKLESIGIRGTPLELFRDYLSDRTQSVKIGDTLSSKQSLDFGVPQGSVLGPTLFLVYINSLCDSLIPNAKIITFADDTAIIFKGKTWNEVRESAENGMRIVIDWLNNNLLTLNLDKTKYIPFSIYKNSQPKSNFSIKAHSCSLVDSANCNCYSLCHHQY